MNIDKAIMLSIAILLDLMGLICLVLNFALGSGILLSFLPDIIGFFTIGLWLILTKGELSGFKKALRLGGVTILETVPVLGDILTSWVILVLIS